MALHHQGEPRLFAWESGGELLGKYDLPLEFAGHWTLWAPSVAPGPSARPAMEALCRHAHAELTRRRAAGATLILEENHTQPELARRCLLGAGFRFEEDRVLYWRDLQGLPLPSPRPELAVTTTAELPQDRLVALGEHVGADAELLPRLASPPEDQRLWLVGWERGEPVALALAEPPPGEERLTLFHLGLVPAARGRGVARDLLLELLRRAQEAGATEYLGSTAAGNRSMLRLFERIGCERVGGRQSFRL